MYDTGSPRFFPARDDPGGGERDSDEFYRIRRLENIDGFGNSLLTYTRGKEKNVCFFAAFGTTPPPLTGLTV